MNIIFDGNYLIHKSFGVWCTYYQDRKKTPEENEEIIRLSLIDKKKREILVRKIIIDMCATINRFKDIEKVIVVIDSHSWRYKYYENYKYALTRNRGTYYEEFCSVIDEIENLFRRKGLIVSRVDGAEGDDLLFAWSMYYSDIKREESVIITGDSDIRQILNSRVALFNNNSKYLKIYCTKDKCLYWKNYFNNDIEVEDVNPIEILLYKVIVGDTSDNIPKFRKGIGKVTFNKFIKNISPTNIDVENISIEKLASYITKNIEKFFGISDYDNNYEKILFNLKMTWLSIEVYNKVAVYKDVRLIYRLIEDININKDKYSYNKKEYTLEYFYDLPIK